jgi:hypothetical protein
LFTYDTIMVAIIYSKVKSGTSTGYGGLRLFVVLFLDARIEALKVPTW